MCFPHDRRDTRSDRGPSKTLAELGVSSPGDHDEEKNAAFCSKLKCLCPASFGRSAAVLLVRRRSILDHLCEEALGTLGHFWEDHWRAAGLEVASRECERGMQIRGTHAHAHPHVQHHP